MTNAPIDSHARWICADCGARADREGDCATCGKGPLVDLAKDGVRDWLLDEDTRRRETHRNRMLWVAVISMVVVDCGGGAFAPPKVATTMWSIPGVLALIGISMGLWTLLLKVFPAKSKFDALKR